MTKPGWRSVLLREETVMRLEKLKQQSEAGRPRKIALGALIEDLVWPVIEGDEILRRYGPFLEEFGIEQDRIYIKDNRLGKIAELTFRNDSWLCSIDGSDNCVHIGFAWAIPKVYRVLVSRGQRMRKIHPERR